MGSSSLFHAAMRGTEISTIYAVGGWGGGGNSQMGAATAERETTTKRMDSAEWATKARPTGLAFPGHEPPPPKPKPVSLHAHQPASTSSNTHTLVV